MLFINQKENFLYKNCGTQISRNNLLQHNKRCSAEPLTCASCTNFLTKFRAKMSHHLAKKHSRATFGAVRKRKIFEKDFRSSCFLREHKRKKYRLQNGSGV